MHIRHFALILDVVNVNVKQSVLILDIVARSATKNGIGKWIGAIKTNHGGRRREGQPPNAKKQKGAKTGKGGNNEKNVNCKLGHI